MVAHFSMSALAHFSMSIYKLCALPQAIYDAYQKVLPKRKPKFLVDDLVEEIVETEAAEVQATLDFGEDTEKGGDE